KLLEISRSVTQLREPDEMFQRVLDAAVKVTGAERGFLFLLPSHSESSVDNLTVAAAHNIRPEEITRGRFRVSRSAISHSLKHGVPVVKGGGSGDPSQRMADFGLRAILCEPLIIQTRVLGILYLGTSQKSSFSRPHAELLRS